MLTFPAPVPLSFARQVLRIISRRKHLRGRLVRRTSHLMNELYFDLLDLVDVILALESHFHITIPDEVPLLTVDDLIEWVAAGLVKPGRP